MIEPVTSTVAPATGTPSLAGPELPLAARYRSADPISWQGSMVYPMYTEQLTGSATTLTLTLLSATPPPGVRGLGVGLSMVDGYVGVDRRTLAGVDVWRDALERGITVELSAARRGALYSLTPVWRDTDGAARSWSGNYGIVVERAAGGRIVLWCSLGAGPPHFADLVVEVSAAPADTTPLPAVGGAKSRTSAPNAEADAPGERDYRSALYDLGVAMFARGEEEQACELWSQAAAGGHGPAAYDLGVVRYRQGEFDEAERYWRIAAEQRGVRAMAGLAELLQRRGASTEAQLWRTRAITAKTVAESLSRRAV
ncbi:tetratricopeptide repeat protein [Nocardia cyriacigeorgica]|uniref:tetratricopeptide repeat protein n=1 Tax=Nocardia cyriacigeorgica TaxID=135487 RepID=UPI0013D19324|nr:tetratricopeptide repeat protein [Nocardia cyriacigeorgica]NEW25981.1 tetratricopeptide repeat protein [Nocardia cyriacigeorgica]